VSQTGQSSGFSGTLALPAEQEHIGNNQQETRGMSRAHEIDIYPTAAELLVKYGPLAMTFATKRRDEHTARGENAQAATWDRVTAALEDMQRQREYAQGLRRVRQAEIANSEREPDAARDNALAMERERIHARYYRSAVRHGVVGVVGPDLAGVARAYNLGLHSTMNPGDAFMIAVSFYSDRHPEASPDDAKMAVRELIEDARCMIPDVLWGGIGIEPCAVASPT
jgi:hypothetical protein